MRPMTIDYDQLIAAHPERTRRVFRMETPQGRVWVKRAQKNHANSVSRALAAVFRPFGGRADTAMTRELARLRALQKRGACVPEIMHIGADYFVLADAGPSLQDGMREAEDEKAQRAIVSQAVSALTQLHEAGGWHGAAEIKNMLAGAQGVVFIDLEKALPTALPLACRQAVDLWFLCFSVARHDASGGYVAQVLHEYPLAAPRRLLLGHALAAAILYIPIKLLSLFLGRDVRQVAAVLQGCYLHLAQQR